MELTDLSGNTFVAILQVLFLLATGGIASFIVLKFQNLAKKQDLEEITKKIETVKADIKMVTDKKFQLYQEQKRVLLEFYQSIDDFISAFVETQALDPDDHEGVKITELMKTMRGKRNNIITKYGALDFFIDDERIKIQGHKLKDRLYDTYVGAIENLLEYKDTNYKIFLYQQSLEEMQENSNEIVDEIRVLTDDRTRIGYKLTKKQVALQDTFRTKDVVQFANLCRQSLFHEEN